MTWVLIYKILIEGMEALVVVLDLIHATNATKPNRKRIRARKNINLPVDAAIDLGVYIEFAYDQIIAILFVFEVSNCIKSCNKNITCLFGVQFNKSSHIYTTTVPVAHSFVMNVSKLLQCQSFLTSNRFVNYEVLHI